MSKPRAKRAAAGGATLIAILSMCGCGSSGGPTTPPGPTNVGGNVSKGPVAGASVEVRKLGANGAIGAPVAGPFTTNSTGGWTGQIAAGNSGPYVLVATGGSYVDEATGSTVTLDAGQALYGILQGTSAQVTPLTQTTFEAVQALTAGGTSLATAIDRATSSATTAFGFSFATTVPSDAAAASTAQKRYAALLGGMSTLLDANPALGAFANTRPLDLVAALASDIANGRLDGLDARGNAIHVPTDPSGSTDAPLPALSPTNLAAWLAAANAYAATVPNLAGVTFGTSTAWNPSNPPAGGAGDVVFSGPGAALLPSVDFTPTTSGVFDVQFIWDDEVHGVEIIAVPDAGTTVRTLYVNYNVGEISRIWSKFVSGGIPGIVHSGGTVTFTDVTLDQLTGGTSPLVLNGQLADPAP